MSDLPFFKKKLISYINLLGIRVIPSILLFIGFGFHFLRGPTRWYSSNNSQCCSLDSGFCVLPGSIHAKHVLLPYEPSPQPWISFCLGGHTHRYTQGYSCPNAPGSFPLVLGAQESTGNQTMCHAYRAYTPALWILFIPWISILKTALSQFYDLSNFKWSFTEASLNDAVKHVSLAESFESSVDVDDEEIEAVAI